MASIVYDTPVNSEMYLVVQIFIKKVTCKTTSIFENVRQTMSGRYHAYIYASGSHFESFFDTSKSHIISFSV